MTNSVFSMLDIEVLTEDDKEPYCSALSKGNPYVDDTQW